MTESFRQVTCFIAQCAVCGKEYEDDTFIPHFPSPAAAKEAVREGEWRVRGDELWCWDCNPLCICSHPFGEHEYSEDYCMEEGCECKEYVRKESK